MADAVTADAQAVRDVALWLSFSRAFDKSFEIERYLGKQWWLINIFVQQNAKDISIKYLNDHMPNLMRVGNVSYYASRMLAYLCEIELIDIVDAGGQVMPAHHKFGTPDFSIHLNQKFFDGVTKYTEEMALLLGIPGISLTPESSLRVMRGIYDFMIFDYVPVWNKFLVRLCRACAESAAVDSVELESPLHDSTEYWLLFHVLWGGTRRQDRSIELQGNPLAEPANSVRRRQ